MASFKNFSRDLSKHSVSHLSHIISHLSPPSYVAITGILVTLLCLFFTFSGRAPSTIPPLIFNPQVVISFYNPPLIPSVSISVPPSPLQVDLVDEEEEENGGFRTCDLFDGRWVFDDDLPSYPPGSCPFIDSAFDCHKNGRKDLNYTKLRWQPKDCTMPRMEGKKMLEILRNKRLAFVGDSLNRNMWESLVCMLRHSLANKSAVFEASGRKEFKAESFYSFIFTEYNCSVEFFRAPFLVQQWEKMDNFSGRKRETLRLDKMDNSSDKYRNADFIVFNSGHWWTHSKTSKGLNYYQQGDKVHPHLSAEKAFKKALTTWAHWVDRNIDSNRTRIFFRGYSWTHFSGGQWNSGGSCDGETLPINNEKHLAKYPKLIKIPEIVLPRIKTRVSYLNITRMTDYRKDAHPSIYRFSESERKPGLVQDCSHWCLPGVPDAWNEILYALMLQNVGK